MTKADLTETHDLSLPSWGPYTKRYMGISHIGRPEAGIRFDLSVYAGLYRRRTDIPNVMWESGYHPWEASADLSCFSYRQEIEWKDRVYCDISFSCVDEDLYVICCDCRNNTDSMQNLVLHYMASIAFPGRIWRTFEELTRSKVRLSPGSIWVDAVDYDKFHYAHLCPTDNLVPDAMKRGQFIENGFVDATGIHLGDSVGDTAVYNFETEQPLAAAVVTIRYRSDAASSLVISLPDGTETVLTFDRAESFGTVDLPLGRLSPGRHALRFRAATSVPVELDGFAVGDAPPEFCIAENNHTPIIAEGPSANSLVLKYADIDTHYGILWLNSDYQIREILNSELDSFMRYKTHEHVSNVLKGDGKGHFTNVFMRPITIAPRESRKVYGIVTGGERGKVVSVLERFSSLDDWETLRAQALRSRFVFSSYDSGKAYKFSQTRMAATTLTNVVYPIYVKGAYIRHNTPGRWWDCLYTWDSGFCGIGLAQIDRQRALECLNAYLTEPGDEHAAFIHHGSMVPVQFYLAHEIWNHDDDQALLEYLYPRLRQYYLFYSGAAGSSTIRMPESQLLRTWDYFYNSGGWDDYPPQAYVHASHLAGITAPVVNTAHGIRIAKLMALFAEQIGADADIAGYQADIETFTDALNTYAFDEPSGYFGYVTHDETGHPDGILRTAEGENFNKGLDGMYPLVAGICNAQQRELFLKRLFDEQHFFTSIGITTVDRQASYYRKDGYWNGAVWMPHQWFFWKTMLDLGLPDEAYRIAACGLEVWKREVEESYNCYEHFIVESGRGAGWHHFGGLSTPVLCWFRAYFVPGTITTGFDTLVREKRWSADNTELELILRFSDRQGRSAVAVCMPPGHDYAAFFDETPAEIRLINEACLNILIPQQGREGRLRIGPILT